MIFDERLIAVCIEMHCDRMGLLERMPILDKTINTPALQNGDAQAGMDDDESLPYPNNVGSRVTPTTSPTNQVLMVHVQPQSLSRRRSVDKAAYYRLCPCGPRHRKNRPDHFQTERLILICRFPLPKTTDRDQSSYLNDILSTEISQNH